MTTDINTDHHYTELTVYVLEHKWSIHYHHLQLFLFELKMRYFGWIYQYKSNINLHWMNFILSFDYMTDIVTDVIIFQDLLKDEKWHKSGVTLPRVSDVLFCYYSET